MSFRSYGKTCLRKSCGPDHRTVGHVAGIAEHVDTGRDQLRVEVGELFEAELHQVTVEVLLHEHVLEQPVQAAEVGRVVEQAPRPRRDDSPFPDQAARPLQLGELLLGAAGAGTS